LLVMPLTKQDQCSFMELVAESGPQDPDWFVSHWWGTAFQETLRMLKFHALKRELALAIRYWICTFANNQHQLSGLDFANILQTPFALGILNEACRGTIVLMDERATPFNRIWCVFEDYVSLKLTKSKREPYLFDVAAILPEGGQLLGKHGCCDRCAALMMDNGDGTSYSAGSDMKKFGKECVFPSTVAEIATRIDLSCAQASNPSDKENILRLIGDKLPEVHQCIYEQFVASAIWHACQHAHKHHRWDRVSYNQLKTYFSRLGDADRIRKYINDSGGLVCLCSFKDYWDDEFDPDHCALLLLQNGADPNKAAKMMVADPNRTETQMMDKRWGYPICLAMYFGAPRMVQKLLDFKADPTLQMKKGKGQKGLTPIEWCKQYDESDEGADDPIKPKVWEVLRQRGHSVPEAKTVKKGKAKSKSKK